MGKLTYIEIDSIAIDTKAERKGIRLNTLVEFTQDGKQMVGTSSAMYKPAHGGIRKTDNVNLFFPHVRNEGDGVYMVMEVENPVVEMTSNIGLSFNVKVKKMVFRDDLPRPSKMTAKEQLTQIEGEKASDANTPVVEEETAVIYPEWLETVRNYGVSVKGFEEMKPLFDDEYYGSDLRQSYLDLVGTVDNKQILRIFDELKISNKSLNEALTSFKEITLQKAEAFSGDTVAASEKAKKSIDEWKERIVRGEEIISKVGNLPLVVESLENAKAEHAKACKVFDTFEEKQAQVDDQFSILKGAFEDMASTHNNFVSLVKDVLAELNDVFVELLFPDIDVLKGISLTDLLTLDLVSLRTEKGNGFTSAHEKVLEKVKRGLELAHYTKEEVKEEKKAEETEVKESTETENKSIPQTDETIQFKLNQLKGKNKDEKKRQTSAAIVHLCTIPGIKEEDGVFTFSGSKTELSAFLSSEKYYFSGKMFTLKENGKMYSAILRG